MPVLRTFAERTVALYEQVGCVQTYSTEAGDVASLVSVKSPAVKIVARNSSNALLSADSKPYLSGVAGDPTFFWFQVATTME